MSQPGETQLYPITFEEDTIRLPVPPEEYDQLPPGQQAALYDRAMAEQTEWNDETIVAHPDWVWAARQLYPHVNPETTDRFQERYEQLDSGAYGSGLSAAERSMIRSRSSQRSVEELSDEELGAWLFDHIGELNGNLSGLALSAADVQNDPQLARALNIGLMRYQNKGISRAGLGNVVEGVFQDPLTYLGIGGGVKTISSTLGRQGLNAALSRRLGQIAASGAMTGAVEGATYAGADNFARQSVANAATGDTEIDFRDMAQSAFFGSVFGGAFGFVLGDAIGLSQVGARRLAGEADTAARNVTGEVSPGALGDDIGGAQGSEFTVAPQSPTEARPAPPQVFVRVDGLDAYNALIPPSGVVQSASPFEAIAASPSREVTQPFREQVSQRLREIEGAELPEELGFDDRNRHLGARMAGQLRRWLGQGDELQGQIVREVFFGDMAASSPAVRTQALQTLVNDSLKRLDETAEALQVERSRTVPDVARIQSLELEQATEQTRFLRFETMASEFKSESGRSLRAIQGETDQVLTIVEASSEQWVQRRAEQARLAVIRGAEAGEAPSVSEALRNGKPIVSTLIEWQRNSLLSAPKTFLANVTGPILNTAFEWLEELAGSQGTRYADDVTEIAFERLNGMSRFLDQSWAIGRMALEEHRNVTGVDFIDGQEAMTRAISSRSYGMDSTSLGGRTVDFIGGVVRVPDAIQLFSDSFLTSRLAIAEVFAQARIKGRKQGLQGEELDRFVQQRIEATFDAETGVIRDRELLGEVERIVARQRADQTAGITSKPTDALIAAGEELFRSHPALRLIQPFWRTPLRLLQQGVRRMPVLQQFSQSFRRDLSGQNGYRAYVRARGQFAMAQAIAGLTIIATLTGVMKGEPHTVRDFRIAAEGEDLDHRDSLGEFGYSNLDPVAMPVRLISRITEEMIYQAHLGDEGKFEDLEERMSAAFAGVLSVVSAGTVEQTMLQGFEDVLEAIQIATNPDGADKSGAVGRWFAQRAATFYPNLARKLEAFHNPETEQGSDFQTSLIAATGLKDTLQSLMGLELPRVTTRRNMLGEPVNQDAIYSAFGLVADEKSDPVREELQDLMVTTGVFLNPMRYRRGEANDMDLRYEMTDDGSTTMFDAWQANMAYVRDGDETSYVRQRLQALHESDTYQRASAGRKGRPGLRLELTQEVFRDAREMAWRRTLSDNPEFARRYLRNQIEERLRSYQ